MDRTQVSCTAGDSLSYEPPEKPPIKGKHSQNSDPQWRVSVPHLGLLVMPRNTFDDHDCVGSIANGILWVEARDDAKHLSKHRTASPKEVSGPNVRSAKFKKL